MLVVCCCFTISLILLRCQFAHASFGIPPQLSGGELVRQSSGVIVSAGTSLTSTHASIQLEGRFSQAAVALTAVYVPIASQSIAIGDALLRLADGNGSIRPETLFDDVQAKILTLQSFVTSTANLPSLLATVQATVGTVVRNELSNVLVRMNSTLTNLRNALTGLRTGVINARTTAAGGVYTTANLELNIPSSLTGAVQTAANGFRTALAAVEASAQKSSQSIRKANAFAAIGQSLGNGSALIEQQQQQLWEGQLLLDYERIMSFHAELESLANSQLPLVVGLLGAFTANVEPLTELYAQVSSVYGHITTGLKLSVLNGYQTLVASTFRDIRDLLEQRLALMQPAIYRLSEIVVQQDRYASACYDAYAPRIEQYLAESGLPLGTGCLNVELGREKVLVEALLEVIYELKFSLEDTHAYLLTCLRLPQFDQQLAIDCLQEHSAFSEIIPCTTTSQYATLLQLLCKEVDSIRFRLWTCLSREVAQLQPRTARILQDIDGCTRNGPPSAASG